MYIKTIVNVVYFTFKKFRKNKYISVLKFWKKLIVKTKNNEFTNIK